MLNQRLRAVSQYLPQQPTIKQQAYLLLHNLEALFGGAAGGGKSSALLMAALLYVDVPGYAALLLRRTFADLAMPGALMSRSFEWLYGTDAKWNDKTKTWRFPSGATITFGYLQYDRDKYNYQSSEFQFVGFDELTQFTLPMYTYLFSRMRRPLDPANPLAHVPLRMRGGTNPGGIGAQWVYDRFISDDNAVDRRMRRRIFIPSKLDDNPHLDSETYIASLGETDRETKAALLDGRWLFTLGGVKFMREWFLGRNRIPENVVPALVKKVRVWDLAGTKPHDKNPDPDWTRGLLMGIDARKNYYMLDMVGCRDTPGNVENLIRSTAERDGSGVRVHIQQDPGQAGKAQIEHFKRNVLNGFRVIGEPTGNKSKEDRADPASGAAENGLIYMVRGDWNNDFLTEAEMFPQQGFHDDMIDVLADAYRILSQRTGAKYEPNGARVLIPA